jgi:serine/threonine protein kinase
MPAAEGVRDDRRGWRESSDGWRFSEGEPIAAELSALRLLGGGTAYEAWLAFDEVTYAAVVVKLLRPGQVDDPASLRGLRREAQTLERVNHPAIARGLRAVLDGDRPHLVLEALDGPRLSTLVRRFGPLAPQQYLLLGMEVASALHYLHRVGVVHLDVKPSNVIMASPARLIDLSVARSVDEAARLDHVVGTEGYLAPEQRDPPRTGAPGPAADVFGLGVTLFRAITGRRPFPDGDPDEPHARDGHGAAPEPCLEVLPASVPPEVVALVASCLAFHPQDRPLPSEVVEGLRPALDGLPPARLSGFRVH